MKPHLESLRESFRRILKEAGASESLQQDLTGLAPLEWENWARSIDESPYGADEWIRALARFDLWGRQNGRTLDSRRMREYLNCCIEGAGGRTGLAALTDLLADYLETHGLH